MSTAKLQLERYRLSSLTVAFNEAWLDDQSPDEAQQYEFQPDFDVCEGDRGRWIVRLSVHASASVQSECACRFKDVEATLWGIFTVADDATEDERVGLVWINAPAILHGIARGIIVAVTGGCVGGPFLLPAINYVDVARGKLGDRADVAVSDEVEGLGDE